MLVRRALPLTTAAAKTPHIVVTPDPPDF